jgi:hypothetical protein
MIQRVMYQKKVYNIEMTYIKGILWIFKKLFYHKTDSASMKKYLCTIRDTIDGPREDSQPVMAET